MKKYLLQIPGTQRLINSVVIDYRVFQSITGQKGGMGNKSVKQNRVFVNSCNLVTQ